MICFQVFPFFKTIQDLKKFATDEKNDHELQELSSFEKTDREMINAHGLKKRDLKNNVPVFSNVQNFNKCK